MNGLAQGLRRGGRGSVPALAMAAVLLLAGCSDDEAGFGLPTQPADQQISGDRADLTGTLHVERNGCFTWQGADGARRWVLWPHGAEQDRDDGARVDVSGRSLGEGDTVAGSGVLAGATALPGWTDESSYFGSFGRFCEAGVLGLVVFDEVRAA